VCIRSVAGKADRMARIMRRIVQARVLRQANTINQNHAEKQRCDANDEALRN
jgi:hypothetical protein